MKKIQLTKGYETIVDDEDYVWLSKWKWKAQVNKKGVYAVRTKTMRNNIPEYKCIYMHREIMKTLSGLVVDHINGNKLDNRKNNLRNCKQFENMAHRVKKQSNNTSGFHGVSFNTKYNKWVAQLMFDGKHIWLGQFKNKQDAIKARKAGEDKYFGEFKPNIQG